MMATIRVGTPSMGISRPTTEPVGAHVLERLISFSELDEFWSRDPELVEAEVGKLSCDKHEPCRIRIWERLEDDTMDDAEDGGIGANPERQRQYGGQRVAGVFSEMSKRVDEVLSHGDGLDVHHRRRVCVFSPDCLFSPVRALSDPC
jgi:hypothetical protein